MYFHNLRLHALLYRQELVYYCVKNQNSKVSYVFNTHSAITTSSHVTPFICFYKHFNSFFRITIPSLPSLNKMQANWTLWQFNLLVFLSNDIKKTRTRRKNRKFYRISCLSGRLWQEMIWLMYCNLKLTATCTHIAICRIVRIEKLKFVHRKGSTELIDKIWKSCG